MFIDFPGNLGSHDDTKSHILWLMILSWWALFTFVSFPWMNIVVLGTVQLAPTSHSGAFRFVVEEGSVYCWTAFTFPAERAKWKRSQSLLMRKISPEDSKLFFPLKRSKINLYTGWQTLNLCYFQCVLLSKYMSCSSEFFIQFGLMKATSLAKHIGVIFFIFFWMHHEIKAS